MAHLIVTGKEQGFTYIVLLMWVMLTGAALGAVADVWSTALRREREAELLYVGEQYRLALEHYGATGRFPRRLEDLLGDEKAIPPKRYLRQIYADPITGLNNWRTVTLGDGQIVGISSASDLEPLKTAGFKERNATFAGKKRYSEWVFMAANAPAGVLPKSTAVPQKSSAWSIFR